jgi:hypothetical protein
MSGFGRQCANVVWFDLGAASRWAITRITPTQDANLMIEFISLLSRQNFMRAVFN